MDEVIVPAAVRLQEAMGSTGKPFCFIGGLAVQRWGEPRLTEDADAMIFTDLRDEEDVISLLLSRFEGRRDDAAAFAKLSRVLLMADPQTGVGLDVSLGAFEYERNAVEAASEADYAPGVRLRTCSAEHLIVYKVFAARDIDWHDVKGILIRQQGRLDFDLIERELGPLIELRETPELWGRWHALRDRYR